MMPTESSGDGEPDAAGGTAGAAGDAGHPGGAGQLPEAGIPPGGPATRWRPWSGRARARDLICAAGLVLSGVWYLAMIPLTPALIATRPVLLELLSGSTTSIVAAGAFSDVDSKLRMTVVVAAALPGLMKFDLFFWWAGVLWGRRAMLWLGTRGGRWAAVVGVIERRGPRLAGPVVAISAFLPGAPTPVIYAAAGSVGLGAIAFGIFDLVGTTAWAILLAVLGYNLGTDGVTAANLVSRYALISILVLLAAALAPQAWHIARAWRVRSRARARPGHAHGTSGNAP
jgi:membrane-associated protein